ncbi:MAG: hypothetical protein RL480_1878 [Pseudomonadota bacterium]|jgi:uncharacterized membrane protein
MVNILGNLNRALLLGGTLLVLVIAILNGGDIMTNGNWLNAFLRFVHAVVGVLWIGLLYYFNFVQIPTMPKVPAELKPAVGKYIAPEALFWFRWSALATLVIGIAIAGAPPNLYLVQALTFQEGFRNIGLGMWLGIIMAANVWMFIWPAQKIALGIVDGTPDEKAAAAKKAMLFSRTNFVLSFPMLYCMVTRGVLG